MNHYEVTAYIKGTFKIKILSLWSCIYLTLMTAKFRPKGNIFLQKGFSKLAGGNAELVSCRKMTLIEPPVTVPFYQANRNAPNQISSSCNTPDLYLDNTPLCLSYSDRLS
jgi:hypothetical protein